MKAIKYYRTSQYGVTREFVHPECEADGKCISGLTGMKTLNCVVRELIHDLSGGLVRFEEVIAPK